MAKYVDNNITFNNVSDIVKSVSSAPFGKSKNYTFNETETDITAIGKKVFNAVDIDWNGADLYNASGIWPTNTNPTIVNNESSTITLKTIRQ